MIFALLVAATCLSNRSELPVALLTADKDGIFLVCPTGETTWRYRTESPAVQVGSLYGWVYWRDANGHTGRVDVVTGRIASANAAEAEKAFKGRPPVGETADLVARAGLSTNGLTAPVYQQRTFLWPNDTCVVVPREDVAKMRESALKAGLAVPKRPRKVLVVSRSFGYGHVEALAWGARGLVAAGEATGAFVATATDDSSVLADVKCLAGFDAVVVNNCTSIGEKSCRGIEKALVGYVSNGGGLVLLHSSMDAFYDCPEVQRMSGGLFFGHPWGLGDWSVVNEAPAHPLNAPFGGLSTFRITDEIYMQKTPPYDRSKTHVILSMNTKDEATAASGKRWSESKVVKDRFPLRPDGDFAVSWLHGWEKGRVFHSSFGHDRHAFLDPRTFAHILLGVQYAAGDIEDP